MNKWISAKTPPDSSRDVLAYASDETCWIANYFKGDSRCEWQSAETGGNLLGVTHWRPLPRKPGEK